MGSCPLISSDGHVVEPPELWKDRMDASFGDLVPRLVEGEASDYWLCGKNRMGVLGSVGGNTGERFDRPAYELEREGKFADVRVGAYDPHAHIRDIEIDGVYATMIYPSIARQMFATIRDHGLARAICAAYNDWLAEFCSAYPGRLNGVPMIFLEDDVEAGIAELRRCRSLGLVSAMISNLPAPDQTYDNPRYEPFWAAAEEMGVPLSFHTGSERPDPARDSLGDSSLIGFSSADLVNIEHQSKMSLCHMIFSGVFERYPGLKLVFVEHGVGWVPYFMQSLDTAYSDTPFVPYRFKGDTLPSEYMRRNVFHSFQEDPLAIEQRYTIGVDNLMWGSDYPHGESTWPNSRGVLERMLREIPEDERAKISGFNCARLFNIDVPDSP